MPRKNRSPKHSQYVTTYTSSAKRRYGTKHQAQKAAEERMLLHPGLKLTYYQDIDGGWYLTSKK